MTTIQITGVQHPAGRGREAVRAFGFRPADPSRKIVEVLISVEEAGEIISDAQALQEFPEVEVDDRSWVLVLDAGDLRIVHIREEPTA